MEELYEKPKLQMLLYFVRKTKQPTNTQEYSAKKYH